MSMFMIFILIDSKCKILVVDPALNIVYKQEYKQTAIDSEIKPLLDKLSSGQKQEATSRIKT